MKEGWKDKSFAECINKIPKQKQVKSKDYKLNGCFPIVSQEKELISGYWDDESFVYRHSKPIIIFGDHTKEIKYIDFDFVVGADGTQILSPKDDIDTKFFYYYLLATPIRSLGYARHFKLLKEKSFFIPSLAEQRSIVSRLDAAFAKIDALKANAERQLAEAHALFNRALTEEMTPKEGWEEKMFGEVGTFIRGINFLKNDFIEEGFPCIHYGQIHTKLGVVTHKHLTCIPQNLVRMDKLASKGDIIIAITSEDVEASCKCTAWLGDYDIAVGAHAAIYKHRLNPTFVSYYMKSARFQKEKEQYVHGFKVMEIKPSDMAKISIAFPSETSQRTIVSRLDALSANVRKLEELQRKTLLECDALKQAMLKEVFE
ncbi:MAG: restriction endonuclease subunit S [Bacteroidales bacterium]|nr:restriction endonuclease subunit S [Bacteroidales bacterium]